MKLVSFKSASKWTLINLQCFNVLWFVFTLKVLFRCKHLLSSRNPSIRLLALDTIANSCRALQSHQGKQYVILELPLTVYLILAEQLCFERACISYKVSACCDYLILDTISDELLPMIHEIWMPYSARFVDEEKLVTKKVPILRISQKIISWIEIKFEFFKCMYENKYIYFIKGCWVFNGDGRYIWRFHLSTLYQGCVP